jgi:hypothetical protein
MVSQSTNREKGFFLGKARRQNPSAHMLFFKPARTSMLGKTRTAAQRAPDGTPGVAPRTRCTRAVTSPWRTCRDLALATLGGDRARLWSGRKPAGRSTAGHGCGRSTLQLQRGECCRQLRGRRGGGNPVCLRMGRVGAWATDTDRQPIEVQRPCGGRALQWTAWGCACRHVAHSRSHLSLTCMFLWQPTPTTLGLTAACTTTLLTMAPGAPSTSRTSQACPRTPGLTPSLTTIAKPMRAPLPPSWSKTVIGRPEVPQC